MILEPDSRTILARQYPLYPAQLRHGLTSHPLLEMERLIALCQRLPVDQLEYNAGDIEVNQMDHAATPGNGLSAVETLRSIEVCGSWLALRNVEVDPDYRDLMQICLDDIVPISKPRTGPIARPEAFIFISSPNAVTPFHLDPEHNILLQIQGSKVMTLFPAEDPKIVPPEQLETYHAGGHCNLPYAPELDARGESYALGPGDALYVPVTAPHYVKNGLEVSLSLSITWRSETSDRHRRVHLMNRKLRRLGMQPRHFGSAPVIDHIKDIAQKVIERVV